MILLLTTALGLGLLSSLHCVGMCGPLMVALGRQQPQMHRQLLYHAGRVLAYVLVGQVAGSLGWGLGLAGFQRVVSVGGGLVLIALLLVQVGAVPAPQAYSWISRKVQSGYRRWAGAETWRLPVLGALNGLLPCGMVYTAAAVALTAADPVWSPLLMLAFGLGTTPAMLLVGGVGRLPLGPLGVRRANRVLPYAGLVLALLLVLRGLELGIPYVSPKLNQAVAQTALAKQLGHPSKLGTGSCH